MIKKLFFVSILFLLTSFPPSSALTETQKQQTIKTETKKTSRKTPAKQLTSKKNKNKDYLLELYANDKWGFMGKKFIDEFYTKYNHSKARMNFRAVAMLGGLFGFLFLVLAINVGEEAILIPWAIGGIIYLLTILAMNENIKSNINERNKSILRSFLLNWKSYKKATPEVLQPFFENLIIKLKDLSDDEIYELIIEIQSQVINNNLKYYELYCEGFNLVY